MSTIQFFIPGIPRPGGSKTAFYVKSLGRAVLTDASGAKGRNWRQDVATVARQAWTREPLIGQVVLRVEFAFLRPKSHMGKYGVKLRAPQEHMQRPDTTKLLRSLEDACTGILWKDDSQIWHQTAWKRWTHTPGNAGALVCVEYPGCHACGREMATVSGGIGNVMHNDKLWCGCRAKGTQ